MSSMMKTVEISDLKQGMYIHAIVRCSGDFVLKKPGWVTTQASIDALKKRGVELVEIDPDKTLKDEPVAVDEPDKPATRYDTPEVSIDEELGKAKALYGQAKQLQKRAFKEMKEGKHLDIDAFKDLSEGLIDSVFRNPGALSILTRIREKDEYLLEHSLNVGILLGIFGRHLKLDEELINDIVLGGLIHDIGKIRVPEEVLHKPGKLTPEEFELIKSHVLHGRDIIRESKVELPETSLRVMLEHHETLNKTGYPHRLGEKDISKFGRMASIVDIFDALTAERVYKKAMLPTAALSIIRSMTPEKLDKELVDAFIRCVHIYPIGTLVRLKSERLGIVFKLNDSAITKPVVKLVYHAKYKRHIQVELLDLAHPTANDAIVSAEKPEAHGLDIRNYL